MYWTAGTLALCLYALLGAKKPVFYFLLALVVVSVKLTIP